MKNNIYIETYGCQMNVADTELVLGILKNKGYEITQVINEADVILLNTCSVRDNAEQKIYYRLDHLKNVKRNKPGTVIGILGCMAERLRKNLIEEKKDCRCCCGP